MGIRFLCPNGHKLNVKAYLAGERGICPQCDAKFMVPRESGEQVEAIDEVAAVGTSEDLQRDEDLPPPAPDLPPAPPAETPTSEEVWHVRMASGEQFGPASADVMRGWITEGRVPVDCWVWRTGWPEWKPGGQAITLLNGPAAPAVPVPPELPGAPTVESSPETSPSPAPEELLDDDATEATMPDDSPTPTSPNAHYLNSKRNRQDRARKATFFLGGLVLLLLVVLVVVLLKK